MQAWELAIAKTGSYLYSALHPRGVVGGVPLDRARDPRRALRARARAVGRHRLAVHPRRRHVPRGCARRAGRAPERPVRRRRDPDLRRRLPADRELHLRAARHRADARAPSRGGIRHRDRGRGDPRPRRRAARAAGRGGDPGVHLDARRAARGGGVRAHHRAAPQAATALVPTALSPTTTPTRSGESSAFVELSCCARVVAARELVAMRPASFLPSSTPHWSNESMPQIAPSVITLCSYAATSAPSVRGVELVGEQHLDGRLPGHARGTAGDAVRVAGAERERLGLREQVARPAGRWCPRSSRPGCGVHEADEVDRHERRALVQQLEVRVLPVGAGRAPHDLARRRRRPARRRRRTDLPLLSISSCCRYDGSLPERLRVRHDRLRLRVEEVAVPAARAAPSAPAGSRPTARCGSARPSRARRRAARAKCSGPIATISDRPIADHIE